MVIDLHSPQRLGFSSVSLFRMPEKGAQFIHVCSVENVAFEYKFINFLLHIFQK